MVAFLEALYVEGTFDARSSEALEGSVEVRPRRTEAAGSPSSSSSSSPSHGRARPRGRGGSHIEAGSQLMEDAKDAAQLAVLAAAAVGALAGGSGGGGGGGFKRAVENESRPRAPSAASTELPLERGEVMVLRCRRR